MKSPFDRFVAWAADRLGYIPADRLYAQVRANEELISQLESAELEAARATAAANVAEKQAARYQQLADESLSARANALKYGLPLSQAFEFEAVRYPSPHFGGDLYRLTIRPRSTSVSFVVTRETVAAMRDAPEVCARNAMQQLIPTFERELGRAFSEGATAAA
ncbi:MAG: hypothetical protein ACK4TR_08975 [Phenylobacterium sp.]|uniref:hypothetical protein n=1 Tax=Phenylobacterium sp. TaxID=1871053 RepID=UPI00391B3360